MFVRAHLSEAKSLHGQMPERSPEQVIVHALKAFVAERREFLIIESGPYYVQFTAPPIGPNGERRVEQNVRRPFSDLYAEHGLYAEAVSDGYLEPSAHLGEDGAVRLKNLGWNPHRTSGIGLVFST